MKHGQLVRILSGYVSGSTRIVDLIKFCKTPFELNARPGDEVLIITDSGMDPNVWQAMGAAGVTHGCRVTIALMEPLPHHQAEPTPPIAEAMKKADVNFLLTSKAVGHSKANRDAVDLHRKSIYMEEVNVERLTTGGATLSADDHRRMNELGLRVKKFWEQGEKVHVTSEPGTDLTARIYSGPLGRVNHCDAGICPPAPARSICAFPAGEVFCSPEPGTGEGVVVWDLSVHYPPGLLRDPIKVIVRKGRVVDIQGGAEARQLSEYIKTFGDENSYNCPAEISIGINPKVEPTGFMRTDKKLLGAVHVAMGSSGRLVSSHLHLDGLMRKPTVTVDGKVIVDRGVIQV
jgi:2,5-dihydroxypyridine 5,6-dioxygenase